jgi:hypothetical protein
VNAAPTPDDVPAGPMSQLSQADRLRRLEQIALKAQKAQERLDRELAGKPESRADIIAEMRASRGKARR